MTETNEKIKETIYELREDGASWGKIASHLNQKGFKTATGKPFTGSIASSIHFYYSKGRSGQHGTLRALQAILDAHMPEEDKLKTIKRFLGI